MTRSISRFSTITQMESIQKFLLMHADENLTPPAIKFITKRKSQSHCLNSWPSACRDKTRHANTKLNLFVKTLPIIVGQCSI